MMSRSVHSHAGGFEIELYESGDQDSVADKLDGVCNRTREPWSVLTKESERISHE